MRTKRKHKSMHRLAAQLLGIGLILLTIAALIEGRLPTVATCLVAGASAVAATWMFKEGGK